jgi:hypothetical protein
VIEGGTTDPECLRRFTEPVPNDPIQAAWEAYHGPVKDDGEEDYIPQMPPCFRRGFVDGFAHHGRVHAKDLWKDHRKVSEPLTETQAAITDICEGIRDLLLEKNRAYGDSALKPLRIFSKADTIEQINVRIDDKLSRICRGSTYGDEDTELDLIGYLILKQAYLRINDTEDTEDE